MRPLPGYPRSAYHAAGPRACQCWSYHLGEPFPVGHHRPGCAQYVWGRAWGPGLVHMATTWRGEL